MLEQALAYLAEKARGYSRLRGHRGRRGRRGGSLPSPQPRTPEELDAARARLERLYAAREKTDSTPVADPGSISDARLKRRLEYIYNIDDRGIKWSEALSAYVQTTDKDRRSARAALERQLARNPLAGEAAALEQEWLRRQTRSESLNLYRGIFKKPGQRWEGGIPGIASFSAEQKSAAMFSFGDDAEAEGGLVVRMKVPLKHVLVSYRSPAFRDTDGVFFYSKEIIARGVPPPKKYEAWEAHFDSHGLDISEYNSLAGNFFEAKRGITFRRLTPRAARNRTGNYYV